MYSTCTSKILAANKTIPEIKTMECMINNFETTHAECLKEKNNY